MKTKTNTNHAIPLPILSIRLESEMLNKLDEYSKRTGIPRSNLVRICLSAGFPKLEKMAQAAAPDRT